jgi:hypothetical protein
MTKTHQNTPLALPMKPKIGVHCKDLKEKT